MPRILAQGDGWAVADVLCTSGPQDRPFEEQHAQYSISVVLAGSFQHPLSLGHGMMLPGFSDVWQPRAAFRVRARTRRGRPLCGVLVCGRLLRASVGWRRPQSTRQAASTWLACLQCGRWRHWSRAWVRVLSIHVAFHGRSLASGWPPVRLSVAAGMSFDSNRVVPSAEARVTRTVRMIDRHPDAVLTLGQLARESGLSPYSLPADV